MGLYDEAPHVVKLTGSDFPDSAATGGGAVWLVEFYAPWWAGELIPMSHFSVICDRFQGQHYAGRRANVISMLCVSQA